MGDTGDSERDDSDDAWEDDGRIDVGLLVQSELEGAKGMGATPPPVDLGPRPRALSQARIQVKSDGSTPRVRSSKLRPRRHQRTEPQVPSSAGSVQSAPDADLSLTGRDVPRTSPLLPDVEEVTPEAERLMVSRPGRKLLAPLQIVASLLLLEAALMPSVRARQVVAPWSAWTDPTSPNFVALVFLALLGTLFLFPLSRLARTGLQAVVAALLLALSLVLLRTALSAGLFDAQPALHTLFLENLVAGLSVIVSGCLLLMSLFWLERAPESARARSCLLGGVLLSALSVGALPLLANLEAAAISLLLKTAEVSGFAGDRAAAWLALLALFAALGTVILRVRPALSAWSGSVGVTLWVFALSPLAALSLFVAPADRWHEVLVPVQITTLMGSAVLLFTVCAGHVLALRELGEE